MAYFLANSRVQNHKIIYAYLVAREFNAIFINVMPMNIISHLLIVLSIQYSHPRTNAHIHAQLLTHYSHIALLRTRAFITFSVREQPQSFSFFSLQILPIVNMLHLTHSDCMSSYHRYFTTTFLLRLCRIGVMILTFTGLPCKYFGRTKFLVQKTIVSNIIYTEVGGHAWKCY